jgi:transcriptional regulator with XRE-family HTH domain
MSKTSQFTDEFFNRLDDLLKERGWSFSHLSVESGVSLNALYQMRKRNSLPMLQTVYDICVAFDISLAEFFMFDSSTDPCIIKISERLKSLSPTSLAVLADLVDCLK